MRSNSQRPCTTVIIRLVFVTGIRNTDLIIGKVTSAISIADRSLRFSRNAGFECTGCFLLSWSNCKSVVYDENKKDSFV